MKPLTYFLFLFLTLVKYTVRGQIYHLPAPSQIKSITFVVTQLCDSKLDVNLNDIRRSWYGPLNYSIEGFMSTCSLGRTNFIESNNPILYGFTLPCVGITKYGLFNSSICKNNELYGWMELVQGLAKAMGYNISAYPIKIIVLPYNTNCTFGGLATPSCLPFSDRCFVWINMFRGLDLASYASHEISHTLGLMHSSIPSDQYGDYTCAMGNGTNVCFNAAQSWKLGWRDAVATLDSSSLNYNLLIPLHSLAYNSFIRLTKGITSYFISIRGGTSNIFDTSTSLGIYYNSLSVHVTNGSEYEYSPVFLVGNIQINKDMYIPSLNICVKYQNMYYNFANISLASGKCKNDSLINTYCANLKSLMQQYCSN